MRVELLVEGHGEKEAAPSLISKFISKNGGYVGHTMKSLGMKGMANRRDKVKKLIKSRLKYRPDCILYIGDCDDDCINEYVPSIYNIAKEALAESESAVKFGVIIFNPEYEVIFLSAQNNIRAEREYYTLGMCPIETGNLENRRDSKSIFSTMLGRSYKETTDQKVFTRFVDEDSLKQTRSGRHFLNIVNWVNGSMVQFYCDK